jgi:2-iminobutanoate/2-iminopropanoate deaminase
MESLKEAPRVTRTTAHRKTNLNAAGKSQVIYSEAEKAERRALGLPPSEPSTPGILRPIDEMRRSSIRRKAISAPDVLNEAPAYGSAFTRGLRLDFPNGITHLLISGTASVGPGGETLYPGDFRAQCWRTFHNITGLLGSEQATWHDVVRTTCYIRDIERDYADFNSVRNEFYFALGLDPFPASTGIQAHICRSDLLVEIEALAILYRKAGE